MGFNEKISPAHMTSGIFCIWMFGLAALTMITPATEFSETENRFLKQKPALTAETVMDGAFESGYEEYLNDQFIWRDGWIGLKTHVERILLKRESKDIYFADDGYFIEKHTGSFSSAAADRSLRAISEFAKRYEGQEQGPRVSVMIVPNAVDILQNKLPPFASAGAENEYLKRLSEAVTENVWFDAESVLREHANEDLYYKTDHHWKTLAAFYVYQAWAGEQGFAVPELTEYEVETVTESFEGTIQSKLGIRTKGDTIDLFLPKKETAYVVQTGESEKTCLYDYEALDTKDKYAVYFGGNAPLIRIRTESQTGRNILVVKDSYANCFLPFLIGEFQEITVLDLRYTNQKLSEWMRETDYTDLLVLYNAAGFAEDMNVSKILN